MVDTTRADHRGLYLSLFHKGCKRALRAAFSVVFTRNTEHTRTTFDSDEACEAEYRPLQTAKPTADVIKAKR